MIANYTTGRINAPLNPSDSSRVSSEGFLISTICESRYLSTDKLLESFDGKSDY